MKMILFLFAFTLCLHAAPMGSINDDALRKSAAPTSGNAAIQAQIDALQADIDQRNKILSHEKSRGTHGAFQDIIAAEMKQIDGLRAQMVK